MYILFALTGAYTIAFADAFIGAFTGAFTDAFTDPFIDAFTDAFTDEFTDAFRGLVSFLISPVSDTSVAFLPSLILIADCLDESEFCYFIQSISIKNQRLD